MQTIVKDLCVYFEFSFVLQLYRIECIMILLILQKVDVFVAFVSVFNSVFNMIVSSSSLCYFFRFENIVYRMFLLILKEIVERTE